MDTRPLRRWLTATTVPTAVLLACREHEHLEAWRVPSPGQASVVFWLAGCLADAPPAALLEILAGGAASVTGLLDGCAKPAGARRVLARAGRIAAAVAVNQPILARTEPPQADVAGSNHDRPRRFRRRLPPSPVHVLDARAMPVGRRGLLGLDAALGELEKHPGQRLFAVVRELLGGAPVPSGLNDVPTGAAALGAESCRGSGVCVRACPTQALTLAITDLATTGRPAPVPNPTGVAVEPLVVGAPTFSNDGLLQFGLSVDPALCVDCGQCVDLCPESAMVRVGPLPWDQALKGLRTTLRVGIVEHCSRCGMPSTGAGSLCAVCAFRKSEPFGSELPPGFVRKARG